MLSRSLASIDRQKRFQCNGQWVIAYTAYSHSGPLVSLAETKDFTSFNRLGPAMPPEDKDACSRFPRLRQACRAALD